MITLRKMTMEDAEYMLEWKNYPETRMFAIKTQDKIERVDHLKWLKNNVQHFQIILCDGEVCGAVRVEDDEVSIWVDRHYWGKGIATHVIKLVTKEGFTAKIVPGNVTSMRCFIKAGYVPVSFRGDHLLFQWTK